MYISHPGRYRLSTIASHPGRYRLSWLSKLVSTLSYHGYQGWYPQGYHGYQGYHG